MRDPRVREYAELLVDTCAKVRPGWQVLVVGSCLARPLLEELARLVAERGAYALLRVTFGEGLFVPDAWLRHAPLELVADAPSIETSSLEVCDALIWVSAPENTREQSSITHDRLSAVEAAYRPSLERIFGGDFPWVGCQYPSPALAQEAGLSTEDFADFLYGACLLDWEAERLRMQRYADRFDTAEEVRIVGDGTDLRLSLAGRSMQVDAGGRNMPGGEFFGCPVESSADGTIAFSEFPAVYAGRELLGVRLRFEEGRVVDASADTNEDFLLATLDRDDGARRLGELGVGCNPGIARYMKNTLFDEKIDGTVHLALGNGFEHLGGTNVSAVHWDLVKDLRAGGRIELDGVVVQENGAWAN